MDTASQVSVGTFLARFKIEMKSKTTRQRGHHRRTRLQAEGKVGRSASPPLLLRFSLLLLLLSKEEQKKNASHYILTTNLEVIHGQGYDCISAAIPAHGIPRQPLVLQELPRPLSSPRRMAHSYPRWFSCIFYIRAYFFFIWSSRCNSSLVDVRHL